jgi:hypothetical protein
MRLSVSQRRHSDAYKVINGIAWLGLSLFISRIGLRADDFNT